MRGMMLLLGLATMLMANPASAQPATPPPSEDCGCGVPSSPRGPR